MPVCRTQVCLGATASSLWAAHSRLSRTPRSEQSWLAWWTAWPRAAHLGWMCAATLVNLCACLGAACARTKEGKELTLALTRHACASTVIAAAAGAALLVDGSPAAACAVAWALLGLSKAEHAESPLLDAVVVSRDQLAQAQRWLAVSLACCAVASACWKATHSAALEKKEEEPLLSSRGRSLVRAPAVSYIAQHVVARVRGAPWISLAVAEHRDPELCVELAARMAEQLRLCATSPTAALQLCGYDDEAGSYQFREAVAGALRLCVYRGGARVDADEVCVGAGVAAVLNALLLATLDPGDAVLVPTPCYAAFGFDLEAVAGCVLAPAALDRRTADK